MRLPILGVMALHGLISVTVVAAQGPSGPSIGKTVDAFIQAKMKERPIPGLAVAVIRDGRLEKLSAFGIANLEFGVGVTVDTLFSVASVSKAFAGLAVMRLVEDGSISLDDLASKHLTQLPLAWRAVTVRQLLNHTSGLPVIDVDAFSTRTRAQTIPDALRLLGNEPLMSPVGAQWNYNGTNYMLLGMLIEAVSGTSFAEFCRLRFFEPLGIRTATFGDSRAVVANRATVYTRFRFDAPQPQRIERSEVLDYSMPTFAYPAAGLNISIRDFATWMLALHQERLVTRRCLSRRARCYTPSPRADSRPLGRCASGSRR